jgi:hypothetical protein
MGRLAVGLNPVPLLAAAIRNADCLPTTQRGLSRSGSPSLDYLIHYGVYTHR